jgi:uncharacterized protein YjeT (DUF2065 family)
MRLSKNRGEDRRKMKILLCLLGMVLIVEGLPYFAFPDKMKKWMALIQETRDGQLRVMGLAAMGAGLILVHLFKV